MENINNNDLLDLGSEPVEIDFDPFTEEDMADDDSQADIVTDGIETDNAATQESETKMPHEDIAEAPAPTGSQTDSIAKIATEAKATPKEPTAPQQDNIEKPPVFEYAGATENIDDTSKTFDELRIEKSADFPELEDGKRVSWTAEYGKITKTVADPKGMSIGKIKSDIETSKEFTDSLKKAKDKNPVCKVKPRVTAQSKGIASSYRGVFVNMEDAKAAGKVISIVPAKDGKVYEIRNTEMGRFITPVSDCKLLSEVRAGFTPALPLIPAELMMKAISFFRHFVSQEADSEALINIYWDKEAKEYIIDVPKQIVTKVSVNSQISDKFTDDRYIHYMDIHSHNTMGAFFSAVDDNDEKATRLYTVIGKLNEYVPEIKTRIGSGGKFLDIDPTEVFELIGTAFPDDWKEKVHFRSPHDKAKSKINAFSRLRTLQNKLMDGVGGYALCA